jgi:chaperonin cofactor prefoldin
MDSTTVIIQGPAQQDLAELNVNLKSQEGPAVIIADTRGAPTNSFDVIDDEELAYIVNKIKDNLNDRSHLPVQEQLNILVNENKELKSDLEEAHNILREITISFRNIANTVKDLKSQIAVFDYHFSSSTGRVRTIEIKIDELKTAISELDKVVIKSGGSQESMNEQRRIEV